MPTVVLFTILLTIGLVLNQYWNTIMAGAMIGCGGSDIYNVIKLRKFNNDCLTEDLESSSGCIVLVPNN